MSPSHSAQDFAEPLDRLARAFDTSLSVETRETLCRYLELVASWNERIDLTAARAPEAIAEVLVADAFMLARPALIAVGSRLLDVGTGAGGPAIPLLLMRPDLRAVLVESLRKRVAFLRQVVEALGLGSRVELDDVGINPKKPVFKHHVDVAMSRATFAPDLWLSIGSKLAQRTLVLTVKPEPPLLPKNVALVETHVYQLPFNGAPRAIHCCASQSTSRG